LNFAFAHFINASGGDGVMRDYRAKYEPSALEPEPHSLLCVFVICAETQAEAERLSASINLRRLNMDYGVNAPVPNQAEASSYPYTPADLRRIAQHGRRLVLGTPDIVRARLLELQAESQADELMIITITGDYATRARSYELVAQAFDLAGAGR
jgi:alkanesulfonate monooxygenase SsuD/methylene tetrahydromethanopterin reductase-like flavin-dependent oxidoreductase (luciferase family)